MSKAFGNDFQAAYNQGPAVFDKSLYAGIGNDTQGLISGGLSQLSPVASGGWLNGGNPYFEQALNTSLDNTQNRMNRMFSASGRLGVFRARQDLGKALSKPRQAPATRTSMTNIIACLGAQQYGLGLSGLLDQNAQQQLTAENDLFRRQNDSSMNWVRDAMGASGRATRVARCHRRTTRSATCCPRGSGSLARLAAPALCCPYPTNGRKTTSSMSARPRTGKRSIRGPARATRAARRIWGCWRRKCRKKTPDAVVELPGGLLAVDYQKALREAA